MKKSMFTIILTGALLQVGAIIPETGTYPSVVIYRSTGLDLSEYEPLNPAITNGNVILCPDSQETLSTQVYDTYQWYKNGTLIPGATQQTHLVTYYNDAGSTFSVFVTLGGQSAMSPSVLVDGYMFLPLVVSSYGQGHWYSGSGWEMCEYHELFFEVMLPYNTNVQWFRNGIPISGANGTVYRVMQSGVYSVCGSPAICPDYNQCSIELPVTVHIPPLPVINRSGDTLYTSVYPGQWFAGTSAIPGATGQFLVPGETGWYSFEFTDVHGCKKLSEPFYYELITVIPGDADCNGLVNVSDIISIINFILGNNPQPFCFENADVNADATVNVMDVTATVNIIISAPFSCGSPITDIDGNIYNTVLIGTQCWMKENLKTTRYMNGNLIDYPGTNDYLWQTNLVGAYAWYWNDINWKDQYGALYNWHAVENNNGLCPLGWHVANDTEFEMLAEYLGGIGIAGGKMKSTRTDPDPHPRWNYPNTGATNLSYWTGFPAGYRASNGQFERMGEEGNFWTSSEISSHMSWNRPLYYNSPGVSRTKTSKDFGYSVRCLKDQ